MDAIHRTEQNSKNAGPRLLVLASGEVGAEAVGLLRNHFGKMSICVIWDRTSSVPAPDACFLEISPQELDSEMLPKLDLGVLAWWPAIVPPDVLETSHLGFLNIHPSLLPYGRGKDPNFWCLVEGTPFGVTVHKASSRVDLGPVVLQEEIPVTWESTGGSLHALATMVAPHVLFQGCLQYLAAPDEVTDLNFGSTRPPRRRAELDPASLIQLDSPYTARQLLNLLRARTFPGFPGCHFVDDEGRTYEVRIEISAAEKVDP